MYMQCISEAACIVDVDLFIAEIPGSWSLPLCVWVCVHCVVFFSEVLHRLIDM